MLVWEGSREGEVQNKVHGSVNMQQIRTRGSSLSMFHVDVINEALAKAAFKTNMDTAHRSGKGRYIVNRAEYKGRAGVWHHGDVVQVLNSDIPTSTSVRTLNIIDVANCIKLAGCC